MFNAIAKDAGDVGAIKTRVALENALAFEGSGGKVANNTLFEMAVSSNGKYVGDVRSITGAHVAEAAGKALKAKPAFAIYGATLGVSV